MYCKLTILDPPNTIRNCPCGKNIVDSLERGIWLSDTAISGVFELARHEEPACLLNYYRA
jgi:hypothetical protein